MHTTGGIIAFLKIRSIFFLDSFLKRGCSTRKRPSTFELWRVSELMAWKKEASEG